MKFLKPKQRPQPANAFEQFLHSQPVFNWFDRYSSKKAVSRIEAPSNIVPLKASMGK